jgi:hypothetical protein
MAKSDSPSETFRLQANYTAYWIEMPEGVYSAIAANAAAKAELRNGLRRIEGVDNVELDNSTGDGVVYLTIDHPHDSEEKRASVSEHIAAVAERVAVPSGPKR